LSLAKGLARAGLLLASVAVALAIAEMALRMVPLEWLNSEGYIPEVSEAFHHNYQPGDAFITRPASPADDLSPITNRINSLGMRGPEPATGDVRALLIGDSFIQADEVAYERTAARMLERRLREYDPDALVVSHGMGSWSPLLEWNWYLKIGHEFGARTVFLFVFYNDFDPQSPGWSDAYYLTQTVFGSDGRPEHFDVDAGSLVRRSLRRLRLAALRRRWIFLREQGEVQSPLASDAGRHLFDSEDIAAMLAAPQDLFNESLAALRLAAAYEGFWRLQRPLRQWPQELRKSVDLSEAVITRFAEDVERDGGLLTLVYVPVGFQVGEHECSASRSFYGIAPGAVVTQFSGVQEWLEGVAMRHGVPWLDLTDRLRVASSGSPHPLYMPYDCHWSQHGHEHVANILADWIEAAERM